MIKELQGLRWRPHWTSRLGCWIAAAEWLEHPAPPGWIVGASGHAFAVNVHPELCPSGPTAWRTESLDPLLANTGLRATCWAAAREEDEFADKVEQITAAVRDALDHDRPCYAWSIDIPEYYLIHGYDDGGVHYSGCTAMQGGGPKPIDEFAWDWLELGSLERVDPADDETTVRAALHYALEHAAGRFSHDAYRTGPKAFEVWSQALSSGAASRNGHSYNAACWAECRRYAVEFLTHARVRLSGRANAPLDAALRHYAEVAELLGAAHEEAGFTPDFAPKLRSESAAAQLEQAAAAEARALEGVAEALEELAR